MAQKCEHCDVSEANSDLQELLKEAEKRIAEQECAKTKLMDDVILLQNKFLEVKTQKSELKAQVMKAIPKEKDLRTSDEGEFRIIKVYKGWIVLTCRLDCNAMTSVFIPELIGGQM